MVLCGKWGHSCSPQKSAIGRDGGGQVAQRISESAVDLATDRNEIAFLPAAPAIPRRLDAADLARILPCAFSTPWRWLSGRNRPSPAMQRRLDELGITLEKIPTKSGKRRRGE